MPNDNVIQRYLYELGIDLETFRRNTGQADDILQSFASRSMGTLAKLGSGIGIALGLGAVVDGFKRLGEAVVSANADLEVYEERLRTVLKSQDAAIETLERVKQFAAETPFEIPELISATVQLEAFGQSSQKWLPLVAEASAAMAMDITDMARAVARATSGSAEGFEVLRNAGISSARLLAAGWSGAYDDVQSTMTALENVLGEFSGGMERQAKTWRGILSMVSDAFTQFEYQIGEKFFPVIKSVLQGIQDRLQEMLQTGEAERWANRIAGILNTAVRAFDALLSTVDTVGKGLDRFFSLFERRTRFADLDALTESFKGTRDEIDANISKVEALKQRYAELEAQAKANGQTVAEAAESNEELRKVMNALAEIVPEAATGFDEYNNALGISTDKVSRFLEVQRELESEMLKTLGRQYREQFDEINTGIADTTQEINRLAQLSNKNLEDWVAEMESAPETAANLAAALGDLAGDAQRAMRDTGESFEGAFERLRAERLRVLFEDYQKGITQQIRSTRQELKDYRTSLAVTQDALQRFVRVSGLEDALGVVEDLTKFPGPQTVSDTDRLAVAYAHIAEVFGLNFADARDQVESLTTELLKLSQLDLSKPDITPTREIIAPTTAKDAVSKIGEIYKEMTLKAQEEAQSQGRIWEQSAQDMLDMFEQATSEYLQTAEGISAEDLRMSIEWRNQRIKLSQDVLKEAQKNAEQRYQDERFALENSRRFQDASALRQMSMLRELEDRYSDHKAIREQIARDLVRMELRVQDEVRAKAFESLDEESKKQRQVREMLKAEGSAYGRFLVKLVQTTSRDQVDALLLRFRREVEGYRHIDEVAQTTERDVLAATERAAKRKQEIYDQTVKSYRQMIQGMIDVRRNEFEGAGPGDRAQDEIDAENRLRVILHTLETDGEAAYVKLAKLRLDEIEGVQQLGLLTVAEYKSILEEKLISENTFISEKMRIVEILLGIDRDYRRQQASLAQAETRLLNANLNLHERAYATTYDKIRGIVGAFFSFVEDKEAKAVNIYRERLQEREKAIKATLAREGRSYESLESAIESLRAKMSGLGSDVDQSDAVNRAITVLSQLRSRAEDSQQAIDHEIQSYEELQNIIEVLQVESERLGSTDVERARSINRVIGLMKDLQKIQSVVSDQGQQDARDVSGELQRAANLEVKGYEDIAGVIDLLRAKREALSETDSERIGEINKAIALMEELQRIQEDLAGLEQRWIQESIEGLSDFSNALTELGIATEETNRIIQDTLSVASRLAAGDYFGGAVGFIGLFNRMLSSYQDTLNDFQQATHQGLLSSREQVEKDIREFQELSTVIDATKESWDQYRYTLNLLGDTEKNRLIAQDEQMASLQRFRDTVIRIFQEMKQGIESSLGSVISDALLGNLDEDLGVAIRRAVYQNVIAQIVAAFIAQDEIQGRLNRIVEEGFKAVDNRPGTWRFEQAIRNVQVLSGGLISDIERGTSAIGKAIKPLTDVFQDGIDGQLGVLADTVRDKTDQIGDMTRSLAQAITEPQGSLLISLWTVSKDYLLEIKINTYEMRMILESIRSDGIPMAAPVINIDQRQGDLEDDANRELGAAGLAIAV